MQSTPVQMRPRRHGERSEEECAAVLQSRRTMLEQEGDRTPHTGRRRGSLLVTWLLVGAAILAATGTSSVSGGPACKPNCSGRTE
jgi:hypothetical protein